MNFKVRPRLQELRESIAALHAVRRPLGKRANVGAIVGQRGKRDALTRECAHERRPISSRPLRPQLRAELKQEGKSPGRLIGGLENRSSKVRLNCFAIAFAALKVQDLNPD